MVALVECVPNFSEGRDAARVDRIVDAMAGVSGARVLDRSLDAGHNRAVVTMVGTPDAVGEAAFQGVAEAARLIDLRTHAGEHPRMGATDVVPFVPLQGTQMSDCVELARRVGERIGRELGIPVFLYEEAATRPERRNLAEIRAPQFEGLLQLVGTDPAWQPDFGPSTMHPSAGAVAVGARPLLVAYNAYLNTSDQAVAKAIARTVRHGTGGLRFVKALGLAADQKGRVQVSMNLTNTAASPMHRVLEMIRSEAARYGVLVVETEVVGLVSSDALLDAAEHCLQLNSFARSQVLEYRLLEMGQGDGTGGRGDAGSTQHSALSTQHFALPDESVAGFTERVASSDTVPAGGCVSALLGALASALVAMVSRVTTRRKKFAPVHEKMRELEGRAEALRLRLLDLVDADAVAFASYVQAARSARDGNEESRDALREASWRATEAPLHSARASMEALELASEAAALGNPAARADACVAALAAHAAVLGSALNVRTNLRLLTAEQGPEKLEAEVVGLEQRAQAMLPQVLALCGGTR